MSEEQEVPTEHLHEAIYEEAEKGGASWTLAVALSTAVIAVLAAITSLLAGAHANEAMMDQIQASGVHLAHHETLSKGVTVFQIAIAIAAIPVLTRRKWMWFGRLLLGTCGCIFLILGVI